MSNLQDTITAAARRLEIDLAVDADKLRAIGAQLVIDLSLAFGEPGYTEALDAASDIIALEAGISAVSVGDAADKELRGVIFGFLAAAAGGL